MILTFYLDAPTLFILGIVLFVLASWIRANIWPGWNNRVTFATAAVLAAVYELWSISLYFDEDGTTFAYGLLKRMLPAISDPSGSFFVFHTNVTGVMKADVPWPLLAFLYALFPVWLFLGYMTSRNVAHFRYESAEATQEKPRSPELVRAIALLGIPIGTVLAIMGTVRFPSELFSGLAVGFFSLTIFGSGLLLISLFAVTNPSEDSGTIGDPSNFLACLTEAQGSVDMERLDVAILFRQVLTTVSSYGYYTTKDAWEDIGYDGPLIPRNPRIVLHRDKVPWYRPRKRAR